LICGGGKGFLPRLEWIILSNCLKLTNMRCVHHLLDNMPLLTKLFLSGTPHHEIAAQR
jgi:hypothetical protein